MKLNCGPNRYQKAADERYRLSNWHKFFCLLPRRITGTNECRWLEYIERRGDYHTSWGGSGWEWVYRVTKEPTGTVEQLLEDYRDGL
jgi:hypothetical protein